MSFDPTEDNEEELFPPSESEARDDATDNEEEVAERASKTARKLEPIVLAHVLGPKYQPVKPRVIAKQLKLPSEQHKALKLAIRRLVKAGKLVYGSGHIVRAPKAVAGGQGPVAGRQRTEDRGQRTEDRGQRTESRGQRSEVGSTSASIRNPQSAIRNPKNLVTGTFRRTAKGFGFVRPEGASRGDKAGDIYIAAPATMDASDRDVVRVRLSRGEARSKGGLVRLAGEIIEIVERSTHQFVGTYQEREGVASAQVDGKVFAEPIPVGDPGAKGAAVGDKVVIEMVRFPTHRHPGEAVIVEVLGAKGAPGVDTLSIIREFGLPEAFPEDVLEDARQQADAFDESARRPARPDRRDDYHDRPCRCPAISTTRSR